MQKKSIMNKNNIFIHIWEKINNSDSKLIESFLYLLYIVSSDILGAFQVAQ